jgi:hypothetical protein
MFRSFAALACVISIARLASAGPTTQPTTPILQIISDVSDPDRHLPTPIPELYKPSDFNISYRAQTPPPPKLKMYRGIGLTNASPTTQHSSLDNWKSFPFNGENVWNRPAVNYQTLHAIKDKTTGQLFYYRDFANTQKVPLIDSPYRDQIGTYYRVSPRRDLPLIDDRPTQQK